MIVVGISAYYHNSSACIIKDGNLLSAVEEERFTRTKNDSRFPLKSIEFCLSENKIKINEVDRFVFYENSFEKINRLIKTIEKNQDKNTRVLISKASEYVLNRLDIKKKIIEELKIGFDTNIPRHKICYLEHHLSHAASAFYPSPFEEADILCIDGVGEWETITCWTGSKKQITKRHKILFPHSLGLLYSTITAYLGFKVNSGEYKVMGLAPYGKAQYLNVLKENLLIGSGMNFTLNLEYFDFELGTSMYSSKMESLLGFPPRSQGAQIKQAHCDLACSIQKLYEEELVSIASQLHRETNNDSLVLAGGAALNCVANTKLYELNLYDRIWVQPGANDAGGAIGAAYHEYLQISKYEKEKLQLKSIYLGPKYSAGEIQYHLESNNMLYRRFDSNLQLIEKMCDLLSKNKVIALFRGRMEFGPRALGNRSILANACDPAMDKTMNLKVKFRESFRPFAPVVPKDELHKYFELDIDSPYMSFVNYEKKEFNANDVIKEKKFEIENAKYSIKSRFPAAVHYDGTARVQTVTELQNQFLYKLLKSWEIKSKIPILLNTSFNLNHMPIVCSPSDAIDTFKKTDIDVLVAENFLIEK